MKQVIEYLGGNWFTLKEKIKEIKLSTAPSVRSKYLAKDVKIKENLEKEPGK